MMSLRHPASVSLFGIAFALAACGGASSTDGMGGASSTAGSDSGGIAGASMAGSTTAAGATSAAGTTSSGGSNGQCPPVPDCLNDLIKNCTPSGTCVESETTPSDLSMPIIAAQCYANGVKSVTEFVFDPNTSAATFKATFSKDGTTCFSEEGSFDLAGESVGTVTLKNGMGSPVATLASDANGDSVLTCGGKTYTLPANCDIGMTDTMTSTCTMGTCAP